MYRDRSQQGDLLANKERSTESGSPIECHSKKRTAAMKIERPILSRLKRRGSRSTGGEMGQV